MIYSIGFEGFKLLRIADEEIGFSGINFSIKRL
jgi:hypothetical protein